MTSSACEVEVGAWCEAEVTEGYVVKDKSALVTVWNLISKKKENRDRRMEKGDRSKKRRKKDKEGRERMEGMKEERAEKKKFILHLFQKNTVFWQHSAAMTSG